MALNVGELVAYLRVDSTKLTAGLSSAKDKLSGFAPMAKRALAAAGAAAGAAMAYGVARNLDIEEGRAKLAAQMGLSAEDAQRLGAVAGRVYASNWGDNLTEVNDAIRAVGSNLGDVTQMSNAELQKLTTSALALSKTFNVDVNQAAEAAGKMVTNGLAKNSTEAFDIITTGFQSGLDRSGDFLETLNEYSPQFSKLGIDGKMALGVLSAAMKNGVRDTDVISDAFKEFSIRAIDGSATTADAYETLGFSAEKTAATIAKGGPAAAQMTDKVITELNKIKDPLERDRVGVELFGTQWEDTLSVALPSMTGFSDAAVDVEGATQRMADTAGGTAKGKIESFKRGIDQWITSATQTDSAAGLAVAGITQFGSAALVAGGSLSQIVIALKAVNIQAGFVAAKAMIASVATKVWAAGQWLLNAAMSANPLGLIIIAIIALVAIVIYAWKNSETFRNIVIGAWNAIKVAASAVFGWLGGFLKSVWNGIVAVVKFVWGLITGYIKFQINNVLAVVRGVIAVARFFRDAWQRAKDAVVEKAVAIVAFVKSIPGKIKSGLGSLGNLLKDAGRRVLQGLIDGITEKIGALKNKLSSVTNLIPDWKGPAERDAALLTPNGERIMGGLIAGIQRALPSLRSELASVTDGISVAVGADVAPPATVTRPTPPPPGPGGAQAQRVDLRLRGTREIVALFKAIVADYGGGSVTVALDQ